MSEKHKKKHTKVKLTPEQEAELKIAREKAAETAKAEEERLHKYGKRVQDMSHRQLRSELKKVLRGEHVGRPPVPQAGLTIAYSTVLLAVLENTQTKENPFAKLVAYPR